MEYTRLFKNDSKTAPQINFWDRCGKRMKHGLERRRGICLSWTPPWNVLEDCNNYDIYQIVIFCAQFARHYNYLKDSGVLKFIVDKNFREVNL